VRRLAVLAIVLCSWSALGAASALAEPCSGAAGAASFGVTGGSDGFSNGTPIITGPTGPLPPLLAWGRTIAVEAHDLSGQRTMSVSMLVDGAVVDTGDGLAAATITMASGSAGVDLALARSVLIGDSEDGDETTCDAVTAPVRLPGGRGKVMPWQSGISTFQYGRQLEIAPKLDLDAMSCAPYALVPATLRVTAGGVTRSISIADQCAHVDPTCYECVGSLATRCKLIVARTFRLAWSLRGHEANFVVNGLRRPAKVTLTAAGTSRMWHVKPGPNSGGGFDGGLGACA
jgi:hypothetical protein